MANLYDRMRLSCCIKCFSIAIALVINQLHGFQLSSFQNPSEVLYQHLLAQNSDDFLRDLKGLEFEISLSENQIQRTAQFYGEFLNILSQKIGQEITTDMVLQGLNNLRNIYSISNADYLKIERFLQYVAAVIKNPYQKSWNVYIPELGLGGGTGGHQKSYLGENLFSILEIGLGTAIGITFSWSGVGGVIGGALVGHGVSQLADKAHDQWHSTIYNAPPGSTVNKPYAEFSSESNSNSLH